MFFALSGAKIDPRTVLPLWMIVIPVVLVRMGGIWAGMQLGGRWARLDPLIPQRAWLGLVSQAGVAIGLATVVADVYPTRGGQLRDLLLATIAINGNHWPDSLPAGPQASRRVGRLRSFRRPRSAGAKHA